MSFPEGSCRKCKEIFLLKRLVAEEAGTFLCKPCADELGIEYAECDSCERSMAQEENKNNDGLWGCFQCEIEENVEAAHSTLWAHYNWNIVKEAKLFKRYMDYRGLSIRSSAHNLGSSSGHATKLLKVLKASKEYQAKIQMEHWSVGKFYAEWQAGNVPHGTKETV